MSGEMTARTESSELVLERTFKASREKVFASFAQPERLADWWPPQGWALRVSAFDFRAGGEWFYVMKRTDGQQGELYGEEAAGRWAYRNIDAPRSLVYVDYFVDSLNQIDPTWPAGVVTMNFDEIEAGTMITARMRYDSEEDLQTMLKIGAEQAMREAWDRLDEYLSEV